MHELHVIVYHRSLELQSYQIVLSKTGAVDRRSWQEALGALSHVPDSELQFSRLLLSADADYLVFDCRERTAFAGWRFSEAAKRCGCCGAIYHREQWQDLPLVGYQQSDDEDTCDLEQRACTSIHRGSVCGSVLGLWVLKQHG